jgi:histidinol-phosphate phosphatase family protein
MIKKSNQIQAAFIDRDGTIGEVGKDLNPANFALYPNFFPSLSLLKKHNIQIYSFTNQPDISRGLINENDMAQQYHQWGFNQAYICPHTDEMHCECRKPLPGMLLTAALEHNLDLRRCVVVGDSWKDIVAGDQVGCIKILVKTGDGQNVQKELQDIHVNYQANNFVEGVSWILACIDNIVDAFLSKHPK